MATTPPLPNSPLGDTHEWRDWLFRVQKQLAGMSNGSTCDITLAALSVGGIQGRLSFTDGVLTDYVQPT